MSKDKFSTGTYSAYGYYLEIRDLNDPADKWDVVQTDTIFDPRQPIISQEGVPSPDSHISVAGLLSWNQVNAIMYRMMAVIDSHRPILSPAEFRIIKRKFTVSHEVENDFEIIEPNPQQD